MASKEEDFMNKLDTILEKSYKVAQIKAKQAEPGLTNLFNSFDKWLTKQLKEK